ncbi:MAG: 50S ribosomal protein L23 [Cytophagaceae bacterium]|nr:50S ribosomal protein L23 [Cytophagaceae bacterium]MDW8456713.1 50S ribosomal protein L23 [Cytophagaceae bacterium]
MNDIIIKPLITEKASSLNESGKYVFVVNKKANKIDIQKEIQKLYNVNVEKVNTVICRGKKKFRYSKRKMMTGRTSSYKKAIITVAKGEIIDFYSGI